MKNIPFFFQKQLEQFKVSSLCLEKFQSYAQILLEESSRMNLVAPSTLSVLYERHFRDSLQLMHWLPSYSILDIGSGAGFPGVVLSILLEDKKVDSQIVLVDKSPKKCDFLNRLITRLLLKNVTVRCCNIFQESFQTEVVVARGFAPLKKTIPLLDKHVIFQHALLMKGESYQKEIDETPLPPYFKIKKVYSSLTHPLSGIIHLVSQR